MFCGQWFCVIVWRYDEHHDMFFRNADFIKLKFMFSKGQIISKWFVVSLISSKKRTKTSRHSSKKNSFVRFLEEFKDTKNHFEINWPLRRQQIVYKIYQISFDFIAASIDKLKIFQTFCGLLGKHELYKACLVSFLS